MYKQVKVIFNVNFKTVSSLIKSSFVGVRTLYVLISVYIFIYYLYCCSCFKVVNPHFRPIYSKTLFLINLPLATKFAK